MEQTKDGHYRIPAGNGVRVPVELYVDHGLLPEPDNIAKLARIAGTPGITGQIDVLPDVHFKAKNFIPTGVALRREVIKPAESSWLVRTSQK